MSDARDRNPLLDKLDNLDRMLVTTGDPPLPVEGPFLAGAPEHEEPEFPDPPPPFEPDALIGELETLASVLSPSEPLPPHQRPPQRPKVESLDLFVPPTESDEQPP